VIAAHGEVQRDILSHLVEPVRLVIRVYCRSNSRWSLRSRSSLILPFAAAEKSKKSVAVMPPAASCARKGTVFGARKRHINKQQKGCLPRHFPSGSSPEDISEQTTPGAPLVHFLSENIIGG
jgi:hypothetical protein